MNLQAAPARQHTPSSRPDLCRRRQAGYSYRAAVRAWREPAKRRLKSTISSVSSSTVTPDFSRGLTLVNRLLSPEIPKEILIFLRCIKGTHRYATPFLTHIAGMKSSAASDGRAQPRNSGVLSRFFILLPLLLLASQFLADPARATDTNGPSEILLGMSTALSGPAADLGKKMLHGVQTGFARANRAGGIQGRRLRLIALDDGYEPTRTAPNMRTLIEQEKVLAVIGNVGTPTGVAAIPIATEQKTLFFAPFSGAGVFRKNPPDRYVINYRASYAEELEAVVAALVQEGGLKVTDIALFTQRDAYGDAGFAGGIAALKRHGLKDEKEMLHVRYERNTLAVEDALATLLYATQTPRAVLMVGAYAPCAKFIKLAHEAGLDGGFLQRFFCRQQFALAAELGNLPAKVLVTQVVPHPADASAPVLSDYQTVLAAFDPVAKPGFGSLEGYLAARLLILALEKIPVPPTRESLVQALEQLGSFDLGLGEPLQLSATEHQACHRVWLTGLHEGAFIPFSWTNVTVLVRGSSPP
jgi:branched-chain amino acid transport system substrate-binding protein